jgi:hypothetical protein
MNHPQQLRIIDRLIGAWDLLEWSEIHADGGKSYPLGEQAVGQIAYTADGHVAAQLVRAGRTRFASGDWKKATAGEAARAFKEYFGYFGTFSIDLEKEAVIHHVTGGWFPNVEGTDQLRRFQLQGNRLVLDADTEWGKVRIVWQCAA